MHFDWLKKNLSTNNNYVMLLIQNDVIGGLINVVCYLTKIVYI